AEISCAFYLGVLTKEKVSGAHKATTYFIKTIIDTNWDPSILAAFSNKLAKYNVSLKSYQASLLTSRSPIASDKDDETNMDASPKRQDILMSSPRPPLSSQASPLPMSTDTSPTTPIASSITVLGFDRAQRSFASPKQRHRKQTKPTDNLPAPDQITTQGVLQTK
ncbi:unnamed protein product, partial [Rotaria magnacalcarata]